MESSSLNNTIFIFDNIGMRKNKMVCENCKFNNKCHLQNKFDKGFRKIIEAFNTYFDLDEATVSLKCEKFIKNNEIEEILEREE